MNDSLSVTDNPNEDANDIAMWSDGNFFSAVAEMESPS